MKVAELAENLAKRTESRFVSPLGNFKLADDCSTLTVERGGGDQPDMQFMMDEKSTAVLTKYLKLPPAYIKDCPPDFRAHTFRYWITRKSQVDTVVEIVDEALVGLYSPGLMMLPIPRVAAMVERVFAPEDEVHDLIRNDKQFHLDVTSNELTIEVLNPDGIPGRPEVGDITAGGIRFLATPNKVAAPSVNRFFRRAVCSNGMTTAINDGLIPIKGMSVPEVIESMEEAARQLLGDMPERLEDYAHTASMVVPGHPVSFAEQLGHELKVPEKILHNVLEQVRQLPEEGTTVYDVNQAFTSVANRVRTYAERIRLQTIGGALALDAHRMIERCEKCERPLV